MFALFLSHVSKLCRLACFVKIVQLLMGEMGKGELDGNFTSKVAGLAKALCCCNEISFKKLHY